MKLLFKFKQCVTVSALRQRQLFVMGKPPALCYFSSSQAVKFGQPCHATHPHIIAADEVTPRISKTEHLIRRKRLFDRLVKQGG